MSVTYGFFNAQQVNGDYDRKYGADELAEYFASLIGNGISADITDCFKITHISGMQISINVGYAWINGYWVKNDAVISKTLAVAPASGSRVDSVVLRFSKADRSIDLVVVQGDVNASFKALTRTSDIYELMLGYITISAGASAITASMITDTRSNEAYCGILSTFSQKAIPDKSITTEKIADKAITAAQLDDASVEKDKIAADAITMPKLADHAVSVDYTTTLNTTWSGSAAPYTKEQTINGILATDKPLIDLMPSATFADATKQENAWALIYRAATAANKITFYAKAKPTVSIPLQIRCVRK